MRKQQDIWTQMHSGLGSTLPGHEKAEPSSAVSWFTDWLASRDALPTPVKPKKVVDLGCGQGRNAVYLAKLGFNVTAVDYVDKALDATRALAVKENVHRRVRLFPGELDKPWGFEDGFFDAAVDNYSSIDIETLEGRTVFRDELFRTLKPGGVAFSAAVSLDDEYEKEQLAARPGTEPGSCFWPNGKFQKNYDENGIRTFFEKAGFRVLELKTVRSPAQKMGRSFTATNLWMVAQKPS